MNKKPRGNRRPAYQPKSKAGVTMAVKKYVKKVTARTRPEMKLVRSNYVEAVALNTNALASSYTFTEVVNMLQGVGRDQRIGNEIYLHGYHSKGSYNNNGPVVTYVRRLIVGFTSGILTGTSTTLELFDNGTGAGVSPLTIGNNMGLVTTPINKNQFKVYFDKVTKLSPSTATDGTQTKLYNHFTKFGGKKIQFESNNVGVLSQDYRIAEIYLVAQADNDPQINIVEQTQNSAVYFTDP